MAPRIVLVGDMTAPEAVARGRAEMVLAQVSEILDVPETQLLGPLPADLQTLTTFVIAASSGSREGPATQAFIRALVTPAARAHLRALGLQPE
jgi:molybdate transport system substrate-binding protein